MKNPLLDKFVKDVTRALVANYGFASVAGGENMAQINCTDTSGNEIVIKIEVTPVVSEPEAL